MSVCPECGGKMRIIEIATDASDTARILHKLGLGPRPPPPPSRVAAGQLRLPFDE